MNQYGQASFEYLIIVLGFIVIAYGWFSLEHGALADLLGQIRGFYDRYSQFITLVIV